MSAPGPGRAAQAAIALAGLAGRRPRVPVDPAALERAGERAMSARAWAYVAGGAGSERTMAANRAAFTRWRLVPRMLVGAEPRDLSVPLLGRTLAAPLLLAPVGVLELVHREADLAVARAAAAEGVPYIFSSQASVAMEPCAAAMGPVPHLFQLYWNTVDAVAESFVRRAEACGAAAIVLTLDTTQLGWRPRDLDLGYVPFLRGRGLAQYASDPVFMQLVADDLARGPAAAGAPPAARVPLTLDTLLAALELLRSRPGGVLANLARTAEARAIVARFLATYARPALAWDDLPRLRAMTSRPILLKGIQHADDARRALDAGMDGIIVSNHGGRQVDAAIGALDALPEVVAAVAGRAPVLFDSGIRSGADAAIALALGATAVCLGRPYVHGLALAGTDGVRAVLQHVRAELDLTMALVGARTVAALRERVTAA